MALLLSFAVPVYAQTDYAKTFGKHYTAAVEVLKRESRRIAAEIGNSGGDPSLLIPVVFPEVLRYSMVRDMFETAAMMRLYVDRGPSAANFSVGPFQMKPGFAEKVEAALPGLGPLPAALLSLGAYDSDDEPARRRERMLRLGDLDWQIRYLCAFGRIVENRFGERLAAETRGLSVTDARLLRIRFYAGAYNTGFDLTYDQIAAGALKAYYPDGPAMPGRAAYRYADVSVWFALHDAEKGTEK